MLSLVIYIFLFRKLLVGDGGLAANQELDVLVPILYGLEVRYVERNDRV
jgi:hypothetical protein